MYWPVIKWRIGSVNNQSVYCCLITVSLPWVRQLISSYCISRNFRVIKGSREKISQSKIFVLWGFHETLTCGENVEEYGRDWCIRGCHVYHEIWEAATGAVTLWWQAYLPISAWTVRLYCPYGLCFPLDVVWMASFTSHISCSNCLGWYWSRQRTSWIRKTVTVFCCWKSFVRVIFAATDIREKIFNGESLLIYGICMYKAILIQCSS